MTRQAVDRVANVQGMKRFRRAMGSQSGSPDYMLNYDSTTFELYVLLVFYLLRVRGMFPLRRSCNAGGQ